MKEEKHPLSSILSLVTEQRTKNNRIIKKKDRKDERPTRKQAESFCVAKLLGEQGWRSGESTRLPPMWPGFDSRSRLHMWVEFVISSRPCPEGFSTGSPVFLPPQKPIRPGSSGVRAIRWIPLKFLFTYDGA